ncbi:hypothetical protein [Chengkuizengella axinellae]|uniref:Uncharacterized protein n=1 Tax=Chengkuizengella axinellae TaxID=3064388 RepID=A0ABT9J246_9BACL|nr:hypothetical protein [Chengkuizengella sp. 2205SS18-9]MDP5275563.1 hypothetical protein [Chengkuizengella sp. 2205SS18-9]
MMICPGSSSPTTRPSPTAVTVISVLPFIQTKSFILNLLVIGSSIHEHSPFTLFLIGFTRSAGGLDVVGMQTGVITPLSFVVPVTIKFSTDVITTNSPSKSVTMKTSSLIIF